MLAQIDNPMNRHKIMQFFLITQCHNRQNILNQIKIALKRKVFSDKVLRTSPCLLEKVLLIDY